MILKKLCSKNSSLEKITFNKKLLNKKIYGKVLMRNQDFLQTTSCQLDNDYFTLSLTKSLSDKRITLSGGSLFYKEFLYSNRSNNYLKFNSLLTINQSKFSFSDSFSRFLDVLKNKKIKSNLFILNPIKGGFECYSSGVVGFLPRRQGNLVFFKIFYFFKRKLNTQTSLLSFLNLFLNKNHKIKKFSILKAMFCWGKITLYSPNKRKNFARSRKIRHLSKELNFVFLGNRLKKKYEKENKQKTLKRLKS